MESRANIKFFWFNINLFNVGSLQILEHFQAVVFRRTLRSHYNNWAACKHWNNTEWVSTYIRTYNSYPLIPLFVHICHKNLAQDSSSYIVIKWSVPDQEMTIRLLACFGRHFWPKIFIFSFIAENKLKKQRCPWLFHLTTLSFCIKGADFSAEYHSFRKLTTSSKFSNYFCIKFLNQIELAFCSAKLFPRVYLPTNQGAILILFTFVTDKDDVLL